MNDNGRFLVKELDCNMFCMYQNDFEERNLYNKRLAAVDLVGDDGVAHFGGTVLYDQKHPEKYLQLLKGVIRKVKSSTLTVVGSKPEFDWDIDETTYFHTIIAVNEVKNQKNQYGELISTLVNTIFVELEDFELADDKVLNEALKKVSKILDPEKVINYQGYAGPTYEFRVLMTLDGASAVDTSTLQGDKYLWFQKDNGSQLYEYLDPMMPKLAVEFDDDSDSDEIAGVLSSSNTVNSQFQQLSKEYNKKKSNPMMVDALKATNKKIQRTLDKEAISFLKNQVLEAYRRSSTD